MLSIISLIVIAQLQIPGAVTAMPIVNSRIAEHGGSLLGDDGRTMFLASGTIERFPLMRSGGPVGDEDVGFARIGDWPYSRTTSQGSHFGNPPGSVGLMRKYSELRGLCAPYDETILISVLLSDNSLRLSVINLAARGEFPNTDYEVLNVPDTTAAVAARWVDSKPEWYVRKWRDDEQGSIEKYTVEGDHLLKTVIGSTPAGMRAAVSYDPESRLLISQYPGASTFDLARVGSPRFDSISPPDGSSGRPFLWRGGVYFANKQWTYKLNEQHDWDVFCQYAHIASSANGKYWAVRDQSGQAFLVTFD